MSTRAPAAGKFGRRYFGSIALAAVLLGSGVAAAQAPAKPATDEDVRNLLVWNSPWEGRATPPHTYSFRTVFRVRRDSLIAETLRYSTNQRSDGIVSIAGGQVKWEDSDGAEVTVSLGTTGELVGTAKSSTASVPISFKPRP